MARAQVVDAFAVQDGKEPGAKLAALAQGRQRAISLEDRLLRDILGVLRTPGHLARRGDQCALIAAHQHHKRLPISRLRGSYQLNIIHYSLHSKSTIPYRT